MKLNPARWQSWHIDAAAAAALVIVTVAVCLGGIRPLRSSHDEYLAQKAELEGQRDQASRLATSMAAMRRQLAAIDQTMTTGALRLKPTSHVNTELVQLSALAVESGLAIGDIRAGLPISGPHYDTVPIELAGSGTYRTCTMFLRRLRQEHPDTSVAAFTMSAGGDDPAGASKFRFGLRWHAAAPQAVASR